MTGALTRTWFMTTSPRNPAKVRQELQLLSRFDGKNWREKDEQGQLIHQLQFADLLAESDFFEGSVSERYPAFAARDRLRAPKMLGFAYVDGDGLLHITPAGWQLIHGERVNDLFLRQLLKWQLPSWQHGGSSRTRWRYESFLAAGVQPFCETLRVALELDGVTKDEIAIFLLPCLSPVAFSQAIPRICQFRQNLNAISGTRPREEFILRVCADELRRVYAKDIEEGRVSTRETPAREGEELQHFLDTKRSNLLDYADAAMRYFRYTGLFTQRGSRLVVSNVADARRILDELELPLRTDYDDPIAFYDYLGDSTIPQFPWEQPAELVRRLARLRDQLERLSATLGKPVPIVPDISIDEQCRWAEEQLNALRLEKLCSDWTSEEIIQSYDDIMRRRVPAPSLFMEWNTWRAFLHLNRYCSLQPNFSLDLEWLPISHAGGREPDIELVYCGEYAVAVEVTLSQGNRQFATETEPVTRHVERFQERVGIETFGLFVAPTLNESTADWFQYNARRKDIVVIPLTLDQFKALLNVWSDDFEPEKLYNLLLEGWRVCLEEYDAPSWLSRIQQIIADVIGANAN
ncbi:MAG: AlwI family type II restriction endonuclease [Anaerolineae bacterium]